MEMMRRQRFFYCDRCNRQDLHRQLLHHPLKCRNKNVALLVLVKSRAQSAQRRRLIRDTWGSKEAFKRIDAESAESKVPESEGPESEGLDSDGAVKLLFVMGSSGRFDLDQDVYRENQIYEVMTDVTWHVVSDRRDSK